MVSWHYRNWTSFVQGDRATILVAVGSGECGLFTLHGKRQTRIMHQRCYAHIVQDWTVFGWTSRRAICHGTPWVNSCLHQVHVCSHMWYWCNELPSDPFRCVMYLVLWIAIRSDSVCNNSDVWSALSDTTIESRVEISSSHPMLTVDGGCLASAYSVQLWWSISWPLRCQYFHIGLRNPQNFTGFSYIGILCFQQIQKMFPPRVQPQIIASTSRESGFLKSTKSERLRKYFQ